MNRPIPFSGPMVRALLAGTKTQTRRVAGVPVIEPAPSGLWHVHNRKGGFFCSTIGGALAYAADYLPYSVGDRLYVREHWRTYHRYDAVRPVDLSKSSPIYYEATPTPAGEPLVEIMAGRLRVGMHMPRWASRITLTVTETRVERLRDISEGDAVAEGVERVEEPSGEYAGSWRFYTEPPAPGAMWSNPRDSYLDLWDAINGPGAAAKNPFVAAYTFGVELGNIDELAA